MTTNTEHTHKIPDSSTESNGRTVSFASGHCLSQNSLGSPERGCLGQESSCEWGRSYCRLKKNKREVLTKLSLRLKHSQVPGRAELTGCRSQQALAVRRI